MDGIFCLSKNSLITGLNEVGHLCSDYINAVTMFAESLRFFDDSRI